MMTLRNFHQFFKCPLKFEKYSNIALTIFSQYPPQITRDALYYTNWSFKMLFYIFQVKISDPLVVWRKIKDLYPSVARAARYYLSIPPSSIYSERLFSLAGLVQEEHRSRLLPVRGEQLIFINKNLKEFNNKL